RLGLDVPPLRPALAADHGPLLVLGFLGTQIGLERAVALRRAWAYAAPTAAGAGAAWLIVGLPADVGWALLAFGGLVLVGVFVLVHRLQPSWHNTVMGLGAAAWPVAALARLAGAQMTTVVPWLAAFLVLTIVGERLELSRLRRPSAWARRLLLVAVGAFLAGVVLAGPWPAAGVRLAGAGLLAQAAWLARHDVARRTIRVGGATRYMAVALIAGYGWLAVAGGTWLAGGALEGYGSGYDAMVHAIFLGFVFSMVFAHAPVIVPAVLGVPLPYRPALYAPLALLHASLALRLAGDAAGDTTAWRWGGALGETAIVLFLLLAAGGAVLARRRASRGRPPGPARPTAEARPRRARGRGRGRAARRRAWPAR
ncbi:MAG TPA: hypothetical protein VHB30_04215, partial [Solirubrobacteraceae bacterium]|nr:hypothetical protein [Solirubrobacteraceae bacterium]